jgi:hypothetical protein
LEYIEQITPEDIQMNSFSKFADRTNDSHYSSDTGDSQKYAFDLFEAVDRALKGVIRIGIFFDSLFIK